MVHTVVFIFIFAAQADRKEEKTIKKIEAMKKNVVKYLFVLAAACVACMPTSCVRRQVAAQAESQRDSLALVVSAKDSLINGIFSDINAISENLAQIKSRENLISVSGQEDGVRRPIQEINNDIAAIDRLVVDWHGQGGVSLPRGYSANRKKHVIRVCQDGAHANR